MCVQHLCVRIHLVSLLPKEDGGCDLPLYHLLSSNVTLDLHLTPHDWGHPSLIAAALPAKTSQHTHSHTSDLLENQTAAPSSSLPPSLCELIT